MVVLGIDHTQTPCPHARCKTTTKTTATLTAKMPNACTVRPDSGHIHSLSLLLASPKKEIIHVIKIIHVPHIIYVYKYTTYRGQCSYVTTTFGRSLYMDTHNLCNIYKNSHSDGVAGAGLQLVENMATHKEPQGSRFTYGHDSGAHNLTYGFVSSRLPSFLFTFISSMYLEVYFICIITYMWNRDTRRK